LWDLVDAVLLINLDLREDRWEHFLTVSAGIIPPEKLHRIPAVLGKALPGYGIKPWFHGRKRDLTWAARAGCTLSHRRALALAQSNGWQTVLILEDDVAMDASCCGLFPAIAESLTRHDNAWHICYLGFTDPVAPCRVLQQIDGSHQLFEIAGCSTTHAYLIKPQARAWILAQLPDESAIWRWLSRHRAIDRWYKTTLSRHFRITCISPAVLNQQAGFSDIAQRQSDYLGSGGHLIHVPERLARTSVFGLRRRLRSGSTHLRQICDLVRGFHKRLHGF
jgi:GR25 family glycosyltransferase involved in LPS biosynthesis